MKLVPTTRANRSLRSGGTSSSNGSKYFEVKETVRYVDGVRYFELNIKGHFIFIGTEVIEKEFLW